MSTSSSFWTIADLLDAFGPISAARLRTKPAPGEATEEDVLQIQAREDRLYELVEGVLIEKITGTHESLIASLLIQYLGAFVREHDLGIVLAPDGMLRLAPGLVRAPDVSYISWAQLPHRRLPADAIASLYPELAVEILSRGNTSEEMRRKRIEYFDAGTTLVWEIDPVTRSARAYSQVDDGTLIDGDGQLDGHPALPGFTLPLGLLFIY